MMLHWEILQSFCQDRLDNAKTLKLDKKERNKLKNEILAYLNDEVFKYYMQLLHWILTPLLRLSEKLQSIQSQLHIIYPSSVQLLKKYGEAILKENLWS
jgi:hypothetical protein